MTTSATRRPCLRPGLSAARDSGAAGRIVLFDTLRQSPQPLSLSADEFQLVQRMNGECDWDQLIAMSLSWPASDRAPALEALVHRLEDGLYLDGPRWHARLAAPVREPSCIGCYAGEPAALRRQLAQMFGDPRSSGLPDESVRPHGRLRAVLVPHIDYARGGHTYTWAFKELAEQTQAQLFVIIGTSHYSRHRFTLTRKHFQTPLGIVPTDQDYIDRLVHHYGPGLFDDEIQAHFPEHSIELEVVLLQYLLGERRPIRIVPLVVGSFHDAVRDQQQPAEKEDIAQMIMAPARGGSRAARAACLHHQRRPGAHRSQVRRPPPGESRLAGTKQDPGSCHRDSGRASRHDGYFQVIAEEDDRRRICGLPPTYTLLRALEPQTGKLLHYDQYVHPDGYESVSFASMAFYSSYSLW